MGDVHDSLKAAQEAGRAYLVKIDEAVVSGKKTVEEDVAKTAQTKKELGNKEKELVACKGKHAGLEKADAACRTAVEEAQKGLVKAQKAADAVEKKKKEAATEVVNTGKAVEVARAKLQEQEAAGRQSVTALKEAEELVRAWDLKQGHGVWGLQFKVWGWWGRGGGRGGHQMLKIQPSRSPLTRDGSATTTTEPCLKPYALHPKPTLLTPNATPPSEWIIRGPLHDGFVKLSRASESDSLL